LGADGSFNAYFSQDKRYRFKVINEQGDTRILGEYLAEVDGSIELTIGEIEYDLGNETSGYVWTATVQNVSAANGGGGKVTFAYRDYDRNTESVTLQIETRNGTVVANEKFNTGPYGEIAYTLPISQDDYDNKEYKVLWEADRGDETLSASQFAGGQRPVDLPLDQLWVNVLYAVITLILAFVAGGGVHPAAGAATASLWGGVAWYLGIVPPELGAGAVILGIAISAWMFISRSDQGGGVR